MSFVRRLLLSFWLPGVLLLVYFVIRINNYQPATELPGFSGAIRQLFLAFAVSLAYFMSLLPRWPPFDRALVLKTRFWGSSALVLLLILADDIFMIHESLGRQLQTQDKYFLFIHAGLFAGVIFIYWKRFCLGFWSLLILFGVLSGFAVMIDNTGTTLTILGREGVDIEQISETFALLALGAAFGAQSIHELTITCQPLAPNQD